MRMRFYFDYISSNAYLAWTQLPALTAKYDVDVEPVPVLFAGLLGAHGQLGPAEIPAGPSVCAERSDQRAASVPAAAWNSFSISLSCSAVPWATGPLNRPRAHAK